MNRTSSRSGHFTPLLGLIAIAACTQTDSIGTGGKDDGGVSQGGTTGQGGGPAIGGNVGSGGAAPGGGGAFGAGGAAGGNAGAGGAVAGSGGASGYETPRLDAGVETADAADAPTVDAGPDAPACTDPNPALVTCLARKDQCVPSSCSCSGEDGWMCTADCRADSLPLCDGGAGPEVKQDGARPDAVPDVPAAEAPAPANYSCRNDSDCCIAIDTCNEVAYLYSKVPGATGLPSFPPTTTCVPCVSPAVQVRCDQGQCVGEKISTGVDYNSPIRRDHCGPVTLPDAGAASMYQPAYAGAQQTSWGC